MVSYIPNLVESKPVYALEETIEPLFSEKFHFVSPDTSIQKAMDLILSLSINGLPVLDKSLHPVGFISEKDLLNQATQMLYYHGEEGKVEDFMIKQCKTLHYKLSVFSAIEAFTKVWFHTYPVVDDNGKVIGTLLRKDILRAIAKTSATTWKP